MRLAPFLERVAGCRAELAQIAPFRLEGRVAAASGLVVDVDGLAGHLSVGDRLLVTGAGARTAGFLSALQQGLDVPVVPASPLSMVDSSLPITPEQAASINPTLAVPGGLALPDPAAAPFNLLPASVTAGSASSATSRIRTWDSCPPGAGCSATGERLPAGRSPTTGHWSASASTPPPPRRC